jgi:hypothetical protein
MWKVTPYRLLAMLSLLLISGCVGPSYYEPPPPSSATATIIGSQISSPGILSLDTLFIPNFIDGKFCGNQFYNDVSSRWHKPFPITSGIHRIDILVIRVSTFSDGGGGFMSINLSVESGQTYHIRGTAPAHGEDGSLKSTVWIEDDTGKPVTERFVALLSTGGGRDMIPIPQGAGRTPLFAH